VRSTCCSAPDRGAEYCDERVCVSLFVCVCLSTIISSELQVRSLPIFVHMAVAWSSSGGLVIRYVLSVLWMTSYLLKNQGCSTLAAQLKRSAHAALGLAINCAQ